MQSFTRDDNYYEHLMVGETIVHPRGRTVSEAEHMLWTNFVLNTAQLHFNQKMCDDSPQTTFGGRRVVYGGIVFAYVAGLASEETEENAVAVLSYDEGRHLNPVFAGDTLFAESTVLAKSDDGSTWSDQAVIPPARLWSRLKPACWSRSTARALRPPTLQ